MVVLLFFFVLLNVFISFFVRTRRIWSLRGKCFKCHLSNGWSDNERIISRYTVSTIGFLDRKIKWLRLAGVFCRQKKMCA